LTTKGGGEVVSEDERSNVQNVDEADADKLVEKVADKVSG